MRKFVLVLVAALATSAMAVDPNIYLQAGDETGEVEIWYNKNDGNLPSGLGLTVTVSAGTITDVNELSTVYNIYPGQIVIDDGNVTDYNTPVAAETGTGIGTDTVILEFGALYKRGVDTPPAASAKLCSITVSADCTITVTGDDDRAGIGMGIVAEDYNAYPVFASTTVNVGPAECLKNTDPGYSTWELFGKPDCWCFRLQCKGDANGAAFFGRAVTAADLNILKAAFNKNTATLQTVVVEGFPGICADFNHTAFFGIQVTAADLNIYKANFNVASLPDCDMTHINYWKN